MERPAECIALDPVLVYKPAIGTCTFKNVEFDTVLTFTETGRAHPDLPASGAPIAVIGDSHAMGWGVGDTETFSYALQAQTGQPVFNLGVGSYATERSLRRLIGLPEFAQVETIILQYGDNDLAENQNFPIDPAHWVTVFEDRFAEGDLRDRTLMQKIAVAYPLVTTELLLRVAEIPLAPLGIELADTDEAEVAPGDHSAALQTVLSAFAEDLAGKRLILFYVNGHGVRIADLDISLDEAGLPVDYIDLELDRDQHFFVLDDHLTAAGHRHIAERLIAAYF